MARFGRRSLKRVLREAMRYWDYRLVAAGLMVGALVMPSAGHALDPASGIRQYKHTRWTASEGAPTGVTRIAQTPDGFLWLSTYEGLYRFDGVTFERLDANLDQAVDGAPWHLAVGPRGEVWVWYPASKRLRVYEGGRLKAVHVLDFEGTLVDIEHTPDGDIWLAGGRPGQPILRYHEGRWSKVEPNQGLPRDTGMGMAVTRDGVLWVAYENSVFRRVPGTEKFERVISDRGARMRMSLDPEGRVWVTGVGGSRPISEVGGRWIGRAAAFRYPSDDNSRRGQTLFDSDGNLWVARRKYGLELIRSPSPAGPKGALPKAQEFRAEDGLTSDSVYSIFEDREGNIWVGTTVGLDRFRNADVISELNLRQPAAFGDIMFSDRRGNVFIGQRNTIYRVEPRGAPKPVLQGVREPEAICEGPGGAIWVALADEVAVLGSRTRRLPKPDSLESVIKDCGVDRWGRFWFSAEEGGLYLRTSSGWRQVRTSSSVPFRPGQMVRDHKGDLWVSGGARSIARFDRNGPTIFSYPGNRLKEARTIAPFGDGLILAGLDGVALLRRGRLSRIAADQLVTLLHVNGIVPTQSGDTWLFSKAGLSRMRTEHLYRAFEDRRFRIPVRTLAFLDGLADSNSVRTPLAMVRGGDGRLWAATATGIVRVDPARLTFNPVPPKVAMRGVESGGRIYREQAGLELAPGSSHLTVSFAVPSLTIPERVQVRYRLEGQDADWIDPGLRREAFYTNLSPGFYRFHVIAANENGIWNRTGAALEFTIPPTFVQSIWFKLLLAVLFIGLLVGAYAMRVHQVTARLQSRFDIRIAERERIARELHDTLLQGFQGLLLQFKAVANRLSEGDQMRQALDTAVSRAQQVLIEGRDRVKELRSNGAQLALADILLARASEQVPSGGPSTTIVQEGSPRALHPFVEDELQRIVEEAVRNAVVHARAARIEILLQWTARELRLAVRDDGTGIPEPVISRGNREGHFGLVGMRERAERIGGRLEVTSGQRAGTEVGIKVPAQAAYEDYWSRSRRGLWSRWTSLWRTVAPQA